MIEESIDFKILRKPLFRGIIGKNYKKVRRMTENLHNEETLWEGRRHILWFPFTFDKYRIAKGRIYCQHGLLKQEEHECLIYRVLDISLTRTFGNRICGTGTVTLKTTDATDSILVLKNIRDSRGVKEMISDLVETERQRKGITGREFFSAGGSYEDE